MGFSAGIQRPWLSFLAHPGKTCRIIRSPRHRDCPWWATMSMKIHGIFYGFFMDFYGFGSGSPVPSCLTAKILGVYPPQPFGKVFKAPNFRHSATMVDLSHLSSFESLVSLVDGWSACVCLVESGKNQRSTLKSLNSYWSNRPFLCLKLHI